MYTARASWPTGPCRPTIKHFTLPFPFLGRSLKKIILERRHANAIVRPSMNSHLPERHPPLLVLLADAEPRMIIRHLAAKQA